MSSPPIGPASSNTRSLVLAGLRCHLHPDAAAECARLATSPDLDWRALLDHAGAENVAPLLYHAWRSADWLPPGAAGALRAAYVETGSRNALVMRDLGLVLDGLHAADVPVIVLKGAALAEIVYHNVALRPMVDIDVLARREDIPRAVAALAALGWRAERLEVSPGAQLAFENELALVGPHSLSTPVELHWSLVDAPFYQARLDGTWLWDTSAEASLAQRPTRVLGPEAQLLHLCVHLALHHHGEGRLWHHDVATLVQLRGPTLDWAGLLDRAAATDLVLPLQTVLTRVERDWAVAPPPWARTRLAAMRPSAAESRAFAGLHAPGRSVGRRFADDLAGLPTWRQRLVFAAHHACPSPAYMRQRYALRRGYQVPLYYPYRWWLGLRSLVSGRRGE